MAPVLDASNSGFIYPTLNQEERQIRVVTVDHVDTTSTLNCTLGTISLNLPPVYVALSYVWGTDPANNNILVNEREFKVRDNLYEFLTAIAAKKLLHVPIFVDAICINQANKLERDSHVTLMRDVYSCASEVIAWLGSNVTRLLHKQDKTRSRLCLVLFELCQARLVLTRQNSCYSCLVLSCPVLIICQDLA